MPRACAVLLLSVPALALASSAALAQEAPLDEAAPPAVTLSIPIELDGCAELDGKELRKLLAIEFETLHLGAARADERVRIHCDERGAHVTLEPAQTTADVDFSGTAPPARSRLLALRVSELVVDSRSLEQKAAPPPPAPPPKPAPPPEQAPEPEPARESGSRAIVHVSLGGAVRYLARPRAALWGPQIGLEFAISRHFSLGAEGRLELGRTSTQLASVRWVSERAALFALIGDAVGPLDFAAGPGVCLGRLSLTPSSVVAGGIGHEVSGVWAGPELVARGRYRFGGTWFALASIEGGVTTLPVHARASDERELIDTGGVFFSGVLGLGAAL